MAAKKKTAKRARRRTTAKKSAAAKKSTKRKRAKKKKPLPKVAALTIERRKLADLEEHPRNEAIRQHPEPGSPEWEALRESLSHDYFDPMVLNTANGCLVSGHLRRKVMLAEGVEEADVVIVEYDEETHLARLLAANKAIGRDDVAGQKALFEDLGKFGTGLTGFTQSDIDRVTKSFDNHEVNANDEWEKSGMPEFAVAEKDIKLTVIFRTNAERLAWVKKHKIKVTSVHSRQFTSRIEDADAGKFIKDLSEIPDAEKNDKK